MQCQEGLRWISIETHSIKSSVCARIQDKKAQQSSCKALKLKTKTEDLRQNYFRKKKLWCFHVVLVLESDGGGGSPQHFYLGCADKTPE